MKKCACLDRNKLKVCTSEKHQLHLICRTDTNECIAVGICLFLSSSEVTERNHLLLNLQNEFSSL